MCLLPGIRGIVATASQSYMIYKPSKVVQLAGMGLFNCMHRWILLLLLLLSQSPGLHPTWRARRSTTTGLL